MHRSVGPDEMRLWILRELAEEVPKPLSITFGKWQFSKVPTDWKMGNLTPFFKKEVRQMQYTTGQSATLVSGKIMENILLETMLWHMENKR